MSLMQSAPAHMPATTVASFGAGFADPDLIRGAMMWTFSPSNLPSPVCWANAIRVNAICPGAVDGPRIEAVIQAKANMVGLPVNEVAGLYRAQSALGRLIDAADIANMAVFLSSSWARNVNGQAMAVDGDTSKLF